LYDKDQKAIFYNYREERKATLSIPLKIGKFSSFQRFSVNQMVLPVTKYTTAEWLISGSVFGVSTNLTTYALFVENVKPYLYSNLALALRLPAGFILMPQAQYGFTENKLFSAKARLEKRVIKNGFMNLSYEQNFRNNLRLAEAGFRYDFSFAQAGAAVRQYNNKTSFVEYARGSIIRDRKTKYLGTDNRTNVGKGGISIIPFLDLNTNGKKDPGEPKAQGLNLHSNGGRVVKNDRDTTIRILGLEPYTSCFIDLDPNSFENISWRLTKETYNVAVDPDILKSIEVPVIIAGEATGFVFLESDGEKRGQGRILIRFFDSRLKPVGKTLTEDDGYFSYFGLTSGTFTVSIDTSQLRKLNMTSDPENRKFTIAGGLDGDIADGLDFALKLVPVDTAKAGLVTRELPVVPGVPAIRKDTTYMILHEISEEVYTITQDSWAIQIGAFRSKSYAEGFQRMLKRELEKDVQITIEGDYYRVRILGLQTREEVDENIKKLNKLGFKELWIIHLLARQQQRVLITREDSLARIKETFIEREAPLSAAEKAQLQLDAFRLRSGAIGLRKQISAPIYAKATIDNKAVYYRLETPEQPILDPTVLEAIKKLMPAYGQLDVKDAWQAPVVAQPLVEPAKREPVVIQKVLVIPGNSLRIAGEKPGRLSIAEGPVTGEPTVALQVAIFVRESQALRAQKRIMSKLNLPVEIVKQFEYYHVIVTGFYSREETFPYYPELAGIGYPGVTLIPDYKKQK
ncbi:MAG TPA: hypothetical protein DEO60_10575, partial [Bacteroidales bacterium]|nr:hypothetical protein [Bacteroidales bacterium]